jgi:ketosteroid isomerase-like protein
MANEDDPAAPARAYYRAIDAGAYEDLRALLGEGFVQHRPDRTLDGADSFVQFMREDRPETDTSHVVDHVYRGTVGDGSPEDATDGTRVAVEGRLERANGETWFRFVDVFVVRDGLLRSLRTYTV